MLCFLIGLLEVEICAIEGVEMRIQAGLARNSRQSRSVDGIEMKTSIMYGRKKEREQASLFIQYLL